MYRKRLGRSVRNDNNGDADQLIANLEVERRKRLAREVTRIEDGQDSGTAVLTRRRGINRTTVKLVDLANHASQLPILGDQVAAWLRATHARVAPATLARMKVAFGEVIKFVLDLEPVSDPTLGFVRPERIEDFAEIHGMMFILKLRDDNRTKLTRIHSYRRVKRLVEGTARFHGHTLIWPSGIWRERFGSDSNNYEEAQVKALVRAASAALRIVKARQIAANLLANTVSPRHGNRPRDVAEMLAYVRDILSLSPQSQKALIIQGHRRFVRETKERETPSGGRGYFACLHEFIPSRLELAFAVILVLARTGWNLQTVLDLDVNDWCEPYPLGGENGHEYWLIRSVKTRPQERYQETISLQNPEFHVYQVIKWAIEATEPLRKAVKRSLETLGKKIAAGGADAAAVAEYRRIEEMKNRVWLVLDPTNLASVYPLNCSLDHISVAAAHLIQKYKIMDDGQPMLWSAGKLRDSWIIWAYQQSSYNLLVAQWAAGHKRLRTLIHYLENKQSQSRTSDAMWTFSEHFFGEISLQRLDPAVLKGLVENGRMTQEDITKLARGSFHKTQWGAYCRDHLNPDRAADPGHRPGEECRTQSCLGCSQAFWFFESASEVLALIKQLEQIRMETPIDMWGESEHQRRLSFLKQVFEAFDEQVRAEAETAARVLPLPLVEFAASRVPGRILS